MNFDNYSMILENDEWELELNVSDIWNKYSNGSITIQDFCKAYKSYILSKKEDIINKFGEETWVELEKSLPKLDTIEDEKSANAIFDDIYDWADNNEVLIKTNTENEIF